MSDQPPPPEPTDEQRMASMTRRGLVVGGLSAAAGLIGWRMLRAASPDEGIPWPLRDAHRINESVSTALLPDTRLAPEFPRTRALMPRVNGVIGRPPEEIAKDYVLTVSQPGRESKALRPADWADLPRAEMTTELKCIEGWSTVVHWSGVRLIDFAQKFGFGTRPDGTPFPYVAMESPKIERVSQEGGSEIDQYYVGLDAASAMHPQTLLCDAMDGEPLGHDHGAPLRLVTTLKYGIKNIKWLSAIAFGDERPRDYWAEQGYDWYSGH